MTEVDMRRIGIGTMITAATTITDATTKIDTMITATMATTTDTTRTNNRDDDYRRDDKYEAEQGRRYDNWAPKNNKGGLAESRNYDGRPQDFRQRDEHPDNICQGPPKMTDEMTVTGLDTHDNTSISNDSKTKMRGNWCPLHPL